MKSPLVEALRQATDNADARDGAAPEPEDATAPSPGPDNDGEPAQEATAIELGESLEILPIDGEPGFTLDDHDVGLEEPLELQVANDGEPETGSANEIEPTGTAEAPAPARTRPSRAPRLAVYAPFICIGVALASGASHFVYEWFGGSHENNDLAARSARGSESPGIPAQDSLLAPPSPFKLEVDQPAARAGDHRQERLHAELADPSTELP